MNHSQNLLRTIILVLLLAVLGYGAPASAGVTAIPSAAPTCSDSQLALTSDYTYARGSAHFSDADNDAESGSSYHWLVNGAPITNTAVSEGLLLNFDAQDTTAANGETPAQALNVAYTDQGQSGAALSLGDSGRLTYARQDNLSLSEGTIEMWVALRLAGDDPVYADDGHVLFFYQSAGDDYLSISQSGDSGILYAGGTVDGEWESAYGGRASMRGWKAGEWHHLAFTYSAGGNFMRFYVDGVMTADTNEGHYWPPAADGSEFAIGGSPWWNNTAFYDLDEIRISGHVAGDREIAARARWEGPAQPNEIWLPTELLTPGDTLVYEFTPRANGESGTPCASAPLEYPGIPVFDPQPPSTLLPAGATSFDLSVETITTTQCAYAVGAALPYAEMTPFGSPPDTAHTATVRGLSPDPNTLNDVYVRCAAHPDYVLSLQYRSLSQTNPSYPRTGNLWGWWQWESEGYTLPEMAKVDLWLGADGATPEETVQLRRLNPDVVVLTSINTVENNDLSVEACHGCTGGDACEDWYLHDVNGQRIEVWPGSWRINLTNLTVAEYQACYAYQSWLDSGKMADGVFFDNVMTSMSWQTHDIYGNPVQIDANNDGIADDPDVLDAAWKAGVFHELETFRQLMPYALLNGHSMSIYEPGISDLANGISLGFYTADVLEGETSFADLWAYYQAWENDARPPVAVMFESSPPDQIAYGYDYEPEEKIPPSTLEFARTYFPDVRFGLALTLMGDGFFAHEYGDTWHGNTWWYEELDYDLGTPLGPARRIDVGFDPGPNLIVNNGFEDEITDPWDFWANDTAGCQAAFSRDTSTAAEGDASARVVITATSGVDWHIDFNQKERSLEQGVVYDLTFWARADRQRPITLDSQKGGPDWDNYGLWQEVALGTNWQEYTLSFEATATARDARIQFLVGAVTGTVWIDDVRLTRHPPDVLRRDFSHGTVLLNGTRQPQTVTLDATYRRLSGGTSPMVPTTAPLVEFILDDGDPAFTIASGTWTTPTYDSGEWTALGPFYHAWKTTLHQLDDGSGEAHWALPITISDVYTLTVWWPAAPQAITWTQSATFEVVAGGTVIASTTFDQRTGGDEWHTIAAVALDPADAPYVRLVCAAGPCVADALHVRSQKRYNDGSPAQTVTLQPFDGIVLEHHWLFLPLGIR